MKILIGPDDTLGGVYTAMKASNDKVGKLSNAACEERRKNWSARRKETRGISINDVPWGPMHSELHREMKNADLLYKKFTTLRKASHAILTSKLKDSGIRLVNPKDLDRALRETSFNVDEAHQYAVECIYTPLKLSVLERRQAEADLANMRQEIYRLQGIKAKALKDDEVATIENELTAARKSMALVKEKREMLRRDMASAVALLKKKLEDAGLEGVSLSAVHSSIMRVDYNIEEAYERLLRIESMKEG